MEPTQNLHLTPRLRRSPRGASVATSQPCQAFASPVIIPRFPATPPRLERNALLNAIQSNRVEQVAMQLDVDDTLVHVPLCNRGCEPPVLAALKEGCSVQVVDLMLRRGAVVDATGLANTTALEAIVSAQSVWTEETPMQEHLYEHPRSLLALDLPIPLPVAMQDREPLWFRCTRYDADRIGDGIGNPALLPPRMTEELCCAYAACLLGHGADPSRQFGTGWSALERAEQTKRTKLAALVKYWNDWQVCRMFRHLWTQPPTTGRHPEAAIEGPAGIQDLQDVCELICGFVAPREDHALI